VNQSPIKNEIILSLASHQRWRERRGNDYKPEKKCPTIPIERT